MRMYEFPFESVRRDSNIIIYGAGLVGQTYLRQVSLTQYCTIVSVIDRNFARYENLAYRVSPISAVCLLDYDAIVIANDSPTIADEIKHMLIDEYNIAPEKLIYERRYIDPTPVISDTRNFLPESQLAFSQPHKYAIAINLNGGMGDYIIRKNNIQEVTLWDSDILVDLYVNHGRAEFAKNLFRDIANINCIVDTNAEYYVMQKKYLASFYFDTMLRVDFINEDALSYIPTILGKNLRDVREAFVSYGLESGAILYAIHYARCEKDRLNCYTAYNRYHAFHITNFKTSIPLDAMQGKKFEKMGLSGYITLNYGWDKRDGSIRPAAKAWPLEYFSELARMIKERFPTVSVVQTGTKDAEKIANCDQYIFGESIELIKFVLRDSMLHIDSEGGLVHIATQLGTKCVVLFGPTPVKYYGYDVNTNIVSEQCHNCCWFVADCISCYRGMEKPECMYSILPETVMKKVEQYLQVGRETISVQERKVDE